MALDAELMKAVERLNYRVTAGDLASLAGLDVKRAEQGLLALASEAGGHMQVSDAGDIAYVFPRNFRQVLQNKYFRLRLQAWWSKVWRVMFYLIRISFGIALVASIVLIAIAIIAAMLALSAAQGDNDRDFDGGGMVMLPRMWIGPDWYWIFLPDTDRRHRREQAENASDPKNQMSFLESVFSFLFGDGNPNANLEERRWRAIANVIRNQRGVVVAEQVTPYLDQINTATTDLEDYMLPVLTRFNGRPEVSPTGELVYHFPELQVTAQQQNRLSVAAYLKELPWRFSQATSGQLMMAAGLGVVNIVGALMLGSLLRGGAASLGGIVGLVGGIYGLLLAYAAGFLIVPLVRYLWIQGRNKAIAARNEMRQRRAEALNRLGPKIQEKLAFAQQFALESVVDEANLAYSTQEDLTPQELAQVDKIDAEWRRRLEGH
ncbi:hypothetical protein HPC62_16925 [Thermoleptolyngbya sichuanensis A183]|uniref:Uncharacterized protein n=1 Tax=Thermoleptolyngbya sichuanensis A183 TaxID=2737172 RepID=A0A6M8B9C7_9CYAN|nr:MULTISPECIES: hypothetical protein [Thermoleptolyngbya]QKD83654.1 hypothetical protein HPC62_16925 [Thermoleptolyngbya sichuanensis A183]